MQVEPFTYGLMGSVEGTDKIQRQGEVYNLTDDLHCVRLSVRRSNIIFDGNGYTLYQNIVLRYVTNVTVKNTLITPPDGTGIELDHSSNNTIINENNQDNYPLVNVISEFSSWTILPLFMVITLFTVTVYKRLPKKAGKTQHTKISGYSLKKKHESY